MSRLKLVAGNLEALTELPSAVNATEPMPSQLCRDHSNVPDCIWNVYQPPAVKVERVVTYGVSSCSFSVMFTENLEWLAISHMAGPPPIPVGRMLASHIPDNSAVQLIASILPQSNELMKFDLEKLFPARVMCHRTILSRGKLPNRVEGDELFPQMGHSDIGLKFTYNSAPVIEGNVGVGQDFDYWTLFPEAISKRLKDYYVGRCRVILDFQRFASILNIGTINEELRTKLEQYGHSMAGATVQVVQIQRKWTITCGTKILELLKSENGRDILVTVPSEDAAIVADIITPLLRGDIGFQWIHKAIYNDFEVLFKTQTKLWRMNMSKFERENLRVLWDDLHFDAAFAKTLGYILENPGERTHGYFLKVTDRMKEFRMNINVPLRIQPIN